MTTVPEKPDAEQECPLCGDETELIGCDCGHRVCCRCRLRDRYDETIYSCRECSEDQP